MRFNALKFNAIMLLIAACLVGSTAFAQEETPDAPEAVTSAAEDPTTKTETEEAVDEEMSTGAEAAEEAEAGPYDEVDALVQLQYAFDNTFLFFCAVLVLFMQAGFAMVESGFNQSKNVVNILSKNVLDLCVGCLLYWAVGYQLMYPGDNAASPYFGFGGALGASNEMAAGDIAPGALFGQVDFLFQVAFAATAATIVSGAVAGRMKFSAYLVYSAVLTGLIYPISGYWKWGGGWLQDMSFNDFAGSLVVHACGGFAGLAGAIVLGPRTGRFEGGKSVAMPGHNLTVAALGVFILWVGWYGFNPGSQLVFSDATNINTTMLIATNTTLAAAAGGVLGMLTAWCLWGKPDLSMALNGVLGGLVGITANCDQVSNESAIIIGAVAGVLVVIGVMLLDKLQIDDPVGAWPVHGLCGVWGGLATSFFGTTLPLNESIVPQIVGSIAIPVWAFVTMFILFSILKGGGMLRVSPEEEAQGLDIGEHGMQAYA